MREELADARRSITRRTVIDLALAAGAGLGVMGPVAVAHAAQSSEPLPAASPVARGGTASDVTIRVGAIDVACRLLGQGDPRG